MAEKRQPIDELFHDKLGNFELESPDHVWSKIELQRSGKSGFWFSGTGNKLIMSSLLVLAIAGGAYWWTLPADAPQLTATSGNHTLAMNENPEQGTSTEVFTPAKLETTSNPVSGNSIVEEAPLSQRHAIVSSSGFERNDNQGNSTANTPNAFGANQHAIPDQASINKQDFENYVAAFTNQLSKATGKVFHNGLEIKAPKNPLAKNEAVAENKTLAPEKVAKEQELKGSKVKYKPSPWGFELYGRMVLGQARFGNNAAYQANIDARKDAERYNVSGGVGVRANYRLNRILALGLGVSYTSICQNLDFKYEKQTRTITEVTKTGFIRNPDGSQTPYTYKTNDTSYTNINNSINNNNKIHLIDIPLIADIKFAELNKVSLSFQPGVVANVYMKKNGYEINRTADKAEMITDGNNPYRPNAGVNWRMGLSMAYQVNNSVSLIVQPSYTQPFRSASAASYPVNFRLNTLSTDIGLRYQLH